MYSLGGSAGAYVCIGLGLFIIRCDAHENMREGRTLHGTISYIVAIILLVLGAGALAVRYG